jgi:hypothetical protein
MATVYETQNGTVIHFPKENFLPPDDYGTADVEMFPHFMVPMAMTQSTMYEVATKIKSYFEKKGITNITIHSSINSNIYRRNKYIPRKYEHQIFSNIVVITFLASGRDEVGNVLCKGSEPWATPVNDSQQIEERLYTYALYNDPTSGMPQTFFGPINIPYFHDCDDTKPLTKTNVPELFSVMTKFLKNRLKIYGERCIRLQRVVTDLVDIQDVSIHEAKRQISAFRLLWANDPKKQTEGFKTYIDSIEMMLEERS